MNEFLNPKSMSTPGAAGALMMLLANAVCNSFPEFAFRYVALLLSFTIGAVVFTSVSMKIWERGIYWVVNSLIIFSMGVGGSNIAANISTSQTISDNKSSVRVFMAFFSDTAYAQEINDVQSIKDDQVKEGLTSSSDTLARKNRLEAELLVAELEKLKAQLKESKIENQRLQKPDLIQKTPVQNKGFFKRW